MTDAGVRTILDPDSFARFGEEIVSGDPIGWPGYPEQIARARTASGSSQAVSVGTARVRGRPCVVVLFDFAFAGGSLGQAEGRRITRAFEHAVRNRVPVVSVAASGGARMQEGTAALTQMQRIAASVSQARRAGVPHIAVVTDPTTGGVWASLASSADVIIARPGAAVSFAGRRTLTPGANGAAEEFHSEGKWEHGFVDLISDEDTLAEDVAHLLLLLSPATRSASGAPAPLPKLPERTAVPPSHQGSFNTGWEQVRRARSAGRPHADAYLAEYFESVFEIRGDRTGGVDEAIRCGFGRSAGRTIAFIAQTGVPTRPAGFRTASRLLALAERFGLPALALVDTPGALAGSGAEADGVGTAIAELLVAVAQATVPITSVVIGEGGSGGALALLAPGRTWMTPDSFLAVTAPELAAAILKRPPEDVPQISDLLRLTPQDQEVLGVARAVLDFETRHTEAS